MDRHVNRMIKCTQRRQYYLIFLSTYIFVFIYLTSDLQNITFFTYSIFYCKRNINHIMQFVFLFQNLTTKHNTANENLRPQCPSPVLRFKIIRGCGFTGQFHIDAGTSSITNISLSVFIILHCRVSHSHHFTSVVVVRVNFSQFTQLL